MPSASIRVNSHLRPYETSPSPAIPDITVSGHTRHRLQPYKTPSPAIEAHLQVRPVYAILPLHGRYGDDYEYRYWSQVCIYTGLRPREISQVKQQVFLAFKVTLTAKIRVFDDSP